LLPFLLLAVGAPPAAATLRVESTTRGLVAEDLNGTFNDFVQLRLVQNGLRLEWELEKSLLCGTPCFDLVRFEFGPGCRAEGDLARCDRLAPGATLRLRGGNDAVLSFDSPVQITDPLTLDMGAGRDNADGALGNDTILAGPGDDTLEGFAGNDVLDGGDGDDLISLGEGTDRAEGGAGNDGFDVSTPLNDGTDIVNGGLGADSAGYSGRTTRMRIIEANLQTLAGERDTAENDVLTSIERYTAGSAADIITGVLSSNVSIYEGFSGDDQLFGTSGANTLTGGRGDDLLDGNGGDDVIDAKSGEILSASHADAVIDCGTGANDLALIDLQDDRSPVGCETIARSPLGEGPHVALVTAKVLRPRGGAVTAVLRCPRALRRPCAGSLALRLARRETTSTRYSLRPGRVRNVSVALGPLERRIGARTKGTLVSRERGLRGPKTTERTVTLSN
jgi:hypothetical protein